MFLQVPEFGQTIYQSKIVPLNLTCCTVNDEMMEEVHQSTLKKKKKILYWPHTWYMVKFVLCILSIQLLVIDIDWIMSLWYMVLVAGEIWRPGGNQHMTFFAESSRCSPPHHHAALMFHALYHRRCVGWHWNRQRNTNRILYLNLEYIIIAKVVPLYHSYKLWPEEIQNIQTYFNHLSDRWRIFFFPSLPSQQTVHTSSDYNIKHIVEMLIQVKNQN